VASDSAIIASATSSEAPSGFAVVAMSGLCKAITGHVPFLTRGSWSVVGGVSPPTAERTSVLPAVEGLTLPSVRRIGVQASRARLGRHDRDVSGWPVLGDWRARICLYRAAPTLGVASCFPERLPGVSTSGGRLDVGPSGGLVLVSPLRGRLGRDYSGFPQVPPRPREDVTK